MRGKRARQIRKAGQIAADQMAAAVGRPAPSITAREVRRFKKDYSRKEPHTPPLVREITKSSFRSARRQAKRRAAKRAVAGS